MTSALDPLIGVRLGSYQVIEAVGAGGMARIYKGVHTELNRFAAIKVVNWGLQEDPEFTERFRREAQAIASLRHPNIVQIFDFGKYEHGYFMAMEFIDGSDLAQLLRRHRHNHSLLPQPQVVQVIRDIANALDYAHRHGVIHRDIKPSNIMINREGQSILTDFGLVMLQTRQSQVTLGNTFGTPHYVAPEQAISSAAAVPASDIYSLGVILYELATGQLPFDDESPLSVALKHVSELPTPPAQLNPDLSPELEEIILKAMSKQPVDRFNTAGELAAALTAAWSGAETVAPARRRAEPPVLPVGVPPPAEAPNITLPNIAAVAPAVPAIEADQPAAPAAPRRISGWSGRWLLVVAVVAVAFLGGSLFFFWSGNGGSTVTVASPTPDLDAAAFAPPPTTAAVTPTGAPTATPSPTLTATPTLPPATATPTSTPTATPEPTATTPPSATPTATPTPIPTATPTLPPPPSPTPVAVSDSSTGQLKNKILFKTDRAGVVEIYQMDADGRNQQPLPRESWSTYTELEAALPFSPNRQEQIVVRGEGQLDLWRANLVTGQELRVTSSGQAEYDAAWSPVDNRIAYVSEETGNGDIYMLNLDGSAVVRLTDNVENFDKHPTWSPDGARIAFWSDMGFNKTRQIWVVDLAAKTLTSLSDNPFNDWDPVWVY